MAEALLNAYIDANILIAAAAVLWGVGQRFIGPCPVARLRLLNGMLIALLLAPFAVAAMTTLQAQGVASGLRVNLSDLAVAHFLEGGIAMSASDFQHLLGTRDSFVSDVSTGVGWAAWLAIGAVGTGCAVGLARLTRSLMALRRILKVSFRWRRIGRVELRLSDQITVPFSTRGWRSHIVVIPAPMLGQPVELKVSLAHEFQHLRQGDIHWEILLEALRPLFQLNPAFHMLKRQVDELRELRCDRQVLARGRIDARAYCETLLSVCQQNLHRDRIFAIALPKVTLTGAETGLIARRIAGLLDDASAPRPMFPTLLMAPLIAAVLLTAVAIQRPADWSQDRLMLSTVVNLERLDAINRQSAPRPFD